MTPFNLKLFQGDSASFEITVTEDTDPFPAYDLTGCKLYFTLKESNDQLDADALIQKDSETGGISINDAANGKAIITILNTDTDEAPIDQPLFADVQVKTPEGEIFTVATGKITFRSQTTRRTS